MHILMPAQLRTCTLSHALSARRSSLQARLVSQVPAVPALCYCTTKNSYEENCSNHWCKRKLATSSEREGQALDVQEMGEPVRSQLSDVGVAGL